MRPIILAVLLGVFMFGGWGCAPNIPKAEYPVEIEKEYRVPFDRAWNAVKQVVTTSQGTILAEDEASGFISYGVVNPKDKKNLVSNVYVRKVGDRAVKVYFISYHAQTRYNGEMERDFYQKLDRVI